ncbi:hypothetical protein AIOL_004598 [Candidatus Rhodobacter oscarellae]|uniref:Oxidoreductase molybdopterin-binding domain-containing protein n=2 Tax=Candidatus Rhodobacter oscarellae TaxID=1675527 RepID=A0A0J9EAI4_9RHOB|nr:hypothetical protein AIOL_004598 [Candidatus Rhodobacter lobularis]
MQQVSFETTTVWTEDAVSFAGVPLRAVLAECGADLEDARSVVLTALNAYSVEVPLAEIGDTYPIVATRMDGEVIPVRQKGPYWVVYPYDSDASYRTEQAYARSIWQLREISIME